MVKLAFFLFSTQQVQFHKRHLHFPTNSVKMLKWRSLISN